MGYTQITTQPLHLVYVVQCSSPEILVMVGPSKLGWRGRFAKQNYPCTWTHNYKYLGGAVVVPLTRCYWRIGAPPCVNHRFRVAFRGSPIYGGGRAKEALTAFSGRGVEHESLATRFYHLLYTSCN